MGFQYKKSLGQNFLQDNNILNKIVASVFVGNNDLIIEKLSPITNMNILRMNVHFFDNLPKVWRLIQNAAEVSVREA